MFAKRKPDQACHNLRSISDSHASAIRALIMVESRMSERDRGIVRLVCGEGFWPSEAVRQICGPDYKHVIPARLREALDGLVEAFAERRRAPNTSPHGVRFHG